MQNRLRLLGRAWGYSGTAVGLAAGSHVLAEGHTPGPAILLVAWALGAVIALPFVDRRPSLLRLSGLLLPAQLLLHVIFGGSHTAHATHLAAHQGGAAGRHVPTLGEKIGAFAGHAAEHAAGAGAAGGHAAHPAALAAGTSAAGGAAGSPAELAMLALHLCAAVLSVLALRHAERGLAAAWAWCTLRLRDGGRVASLLLSPVCAQRPPRGGGVPAVRLPRPHALGLPLVRLRHRGPPASLRFA